jgi:bifunctional non-homologous end joining protein LigD
VKDVASLAWVAGQGTIELHAYLACEPQLDQPTAVVFDLDPGPPAGLLEACAVAVRLRDRLAELGLAAFAKTSGGSGLHVFVPLNAPTTSYAVTKRFARDLAAELAARHPQVVVNRMSRALRTGRVFIDWGQNDERKQTIAPYSLRATPTPLVSAPVRWDEVDAAVGSRSAGRLRFAPFDVRHRLETIGDPFSRVAELTQRLPGP